ncbi:hypothetical protein [Schleiferilactobacillus harbinensis]|jgi:hypothetical protein|uniref:hypothetical protein n=1 Tax=Schleiferilactobacillus harbinensis TaxID=304207 RepID=UPI00345E964B
MSDDNKTSGIGLIEVITVVLVILKLFGLIKWGWLLVLAPWLISWVFFFMALAIVSVYDAIKLR